MTIREVLQFPDERLHTVAKPVKLFDAALRQLVQDMAETMYAAPGIGLAATQIDVHQQVITIDISETRDQLVVLVNPTIIERDGEQDCEEGCLSVPGVYEKVRRAQKVKVRARDTTGSTFVLEVEGLLAVCVQHEMDHLLGKVFVEYLSRLKQSRLRLRIAKREKLRSEAA
ncbi:MAG: peptide deformylase [Burkholderiales bacterium]